MSVKRKTKVQPYTSPKGQALKQVNYDLSVNAVKEVQSENTHEFKLLYKMEDKISKVLSAYQKLEDESKRKDEIIKELEKENELLKQRLVEKSEIGESKLTQARKQPAEGHVLQRTFTPLDIKKEPTAVSMPIRKPSQSSNPTSSIVEQYNTKIPSQKRLKQSRSVQDFSNVTNQRNQRKLTFSPTQISAIRQYKQEESNFATTKNDENFRGNHEKLNDDGQFMDVLGKLKEKIRKFDEEDMESVKRREKLNDGDKDKLSEEGSNSLNLSLSKVKSAHNFTPKPSNFKESRHQTGEMQALKHIWSQRDEEIKKMDELFSKIDERLNIVQE